MLMIVSTKKGFLKITSKQSLYLVFLRYYICKNRVSKIIDQVLKAESDKFSTIFLQTLVLMWRGLPWPSPPSGSADTKTLAIVCRSGLWMVRQPSRTVPASQLPGRREGWAMKKTLTFAWDEVRCRRSWEGGQLTGWALHTDWRWSGWSVVWSRGWNRELVWAASPGLLRTNLQPLLYKPTQLAYREAAGWERPLSQHQLRQR